MNTPMTSGVKAWTQSTPPLVDLKTPCFPYPSLAYMTFGSVGSMTMVHAQTEPGVPANPSAGLSSRTQVPPQSLVLKMPNPSNDTNIVAGSVGSATRAAAPKLLLPAFKFTCGG